MELLKQTVIFFTDMMDLIEKMALADEDGELLEAVRKEKKRFGLPEKDLSDGPHGKE